ncbi:hypothetical protein BX600DRAFT_540681 [Xylariales sp. PMI_506]|nr:hypothetical protein BX600DRAFT_540681 [Xylariales sp. PMI_506]
MNLKVDTTSSKGKGPAFDNGSDRPHTFDVSRKAMVPRPRISQNTFSQPRAFMHGSMPTDRQVEGIQHRGQRGSSTWTSSSGDIDLIYDSDESDDRIVFIDEYNRLAKKYGIRAIVPGDFPHLANGHSKSVPSRKGSWISRVLRQASSGRSSPIVPTRPSNSLHLRRSISDLALDFVQSSRKQNLKNENVRGLVRLCGKSLLYLPAEYAPRSLVLPTCLRATAQHLVHHADARGIFRVPGSTRVVNALYNYYCNEQKSEVIATTTRCPNLPTHLNCGVHDVATTFKRLLAGLPEGILGSLALFDALVAIYTQLNGDPEYNKTKQSMLRARLMALAIGTVKSQYQRELICAVFGLLCLVGRTAEISPREDEAGRPLPTSDLMGYKALGIMFGPLLMGDLLKSYSMKIADPTTGLLLLPLTPPKSRKHVSKKNKIQTVTPSYMLKVDRVLIANDITEMLIVHWRDIVKHLKSLEILRFQGNQRHNSLNPKSSKLLPSASGSFMLRQPRSWDAEDSISGSNRNSGSPITRSRSLSRMPRGHSMTTLSPTVEESPSPNDEAIQHNSDVSFTQILYNPVDTERHPLESPKTDTSTPQPESPEGGQGRLESDNRPENNTELFPDLPVLHGKKFDGFTASPANLPRASQTESDQDVVLHETGFRRSSQSLGALRESLRKSSEKDNAFENKAPHHDRIPYIDDIADNCFGRDAGLQASDGKMQGQDTSNSEKLYLHGHERNFHPGKVSMLDNSEAASLSRSIGNEKYLDFQYSAIGSVQVTPESMLLFTPHDETYKVVNELNNHEEKQNQLSQDYLTVTNSPDSSTSQKVKYENNKEEFRKSLAKKPCQNTRRMLLIPDSSTASLPPLKEKIDARKLENSEPGQDEEECYGGEQRPATPNWKREILRKRDEDRRKPAMLSPERKFMYENSPRRIMTARKSQASLNSVRMEASPTKGLMTEDSQGVSQRTSSKLVGNGAVKTIAAFFDNASDGCKPNLTGRSRGNVNSSQSRRSLISVENSPVRSRKSQGTQVHVTPQHNSVESKDQVMTDRENPSGSSLRNANAQTDLRPAFTRPYFPETPTRLPKVTLRKIGTGHLASRNEPYAASIDIKHRGQELSHTPSLGTMVSPREQPPVAHHLVLIRPSSATSSRSQHTRRPSCDNASFIGGNSPLAGSPRPGTENNVLHVQIRSLHKQLELRNEEVLQLRRQLETRSNMDIGMLSEQLRSAKRESKMWQERAEAAERRVAAFERFTAKMRALREHTSDTASMILNDGESSKLNPKVEKICPMASSSSCTEHTEDEEVLNDRIRNSIKTAAGLGGDGAESSEFEDMEIKS